jgi:hydroxymethylpyrimidine/phosphomethylpyrimidine kinase
MEEEKIYLLSIAGFDPSGGAGVLADIKTFEANKVHGLGVCTAITFQNDKEFEGVNWLQQEDIIRQIEVLLKRFTIKWVKIGLIENLSVLKSIVSFLKEHDEEINIIWDPIFKASAGFVFHTEVDRKDLLDICIESTLITPNLEEIKKMIPEMEAEEGAEFLSNYCQILLKGGHSEDNKANDILFARKVQTVFEGNKVEMEKHGTGCVLSSAILANLAKGYDLIDACKEGKEYITDFINSDNSLLGFHYV